MKSKDDELFKKLTSDVAASHAMLRSIQDSDRWSDTCITLAGVYELGLHEFTLGFESPNGERAIKVTMEEVDRSEIDDEDKKEIKRKENNGWGIGI